MANRGVWLPLLLMTFALMVGGFMEGVNGDAASSFVRRRLGAGPTTVVAEATCPWKCKGTPFPTCCQLPGNGVNRGLYYCANTAVDFLNCGACSIVCSVGTVCCNGTCSNLLTDPNNCGFCGNKCPTGDACKMGLCNYAE